MQRNTEQRRRVLGFTAKGWQHFTTEYTVQLSGLGVCPLKKAELHSLDFAVTRFLVKLFNTSSIAVIKDCRRCFGFLLPSELVENGSRNLCSNATRHDTRASVIEWHIGFPAYVCVCTPSLDWRITICLRMRDTTIVLFVHQWRRAKCPYSLLLPSNVRLQHKVYSVAYKCSQVLDEYI